MLGNKKEEKNTEHFDLNENQQKMLTSLHNQFQEAVKRIEEQKQLELDKVKMEFQNLFNVSLQSIVFEKDLDGQWVFSKDFKKISKKE
jgi:hypothetical protein